MPEARVVQFCRQVAYIKSYQRDDTSPLQLVWLWSIFSFPKASLEWLQSSNLVYLLAMSPISIEITNCPSCGSHGIFKFWEISNLGNCARERHCYIVTLED